MAEKDSLFDQANTFSIKFINKLVNGDFNLKKFIENVSPVIQFDFNKLEQKEANLYKITTFLNIPFTMLITKDGKQQIKELTFGDILIKMSEKNCHNEGEYKCIFHNESLISHSIFAMLKCAENIPSSMSNRQQIILIITALLHDIGKYGCTFTTIFNEQKVTSFPFHGEYGAGILVKLWHHGFGEFFNKEEWETLVRVISIHKCGYNENTVETKQAKFKHDLLCIESNKVKENLYWLAIADVEGLCCEKKTEYVRDHILFRENFKNAINKQFNIKEFKRKEKLRGCIIQVVGQSASGKSTFIKNIVNYLLSKDINKNAVLVVERDFIMTKITLKRMGLPECTEKPKGKEYDKIYNEYKKLGLSSIINNKMNKMISDGLRQGKIVIVDTVASLYDVSNAIYPDSVLQSFKIAVDILRNDLLTQEDADRMNISLKKQIKLFGNVNELNWLPEKGIRFKKLETISSDSNVENIISNLSYKTRPHLRYQLSWTLGHDNFYKLLNHVALGVEYESDSYMNEAESDITHLISYLYSLNGHQSIKDFFGEKAYICSCPSLMKKTEFEEKCFYIKYMEHCRIFNYKFSRQGRGSIFIKLSSGKIVCIKNLLQRGIEYLTGVHIKHNIIENENIKINEDLSYLDEHQQNTLKTFIARTPIDGYLSFKNDGSLSGINLYPKNSEIYNVIHDLIMKSTDPRYEFLKMLIIASIKKNLGFLPVMCTSGTLTITEAMLSYNVTSICCGMLNVNYNTLCNEAKNGLTPHKAFSKYALNNFLDSINTFWNNSPKDCQSETMCLSFEAIVSNRKCAWNSFHPELAMSYDKPSYRFLGCMYNVGDKSGQFRSHFQLGKEIENTGWDEPMCWKINHTIQVEDMINGLSEILQGKLTEEEFITKFPPENTSSQIFDYEGFVFFSKMIDSEEIGLINDEFDYDVDYGKIKTEEYYKSHKFKTKNVDFLLSLPETSLKLIPLAKAAQEFYPSLQDSLLSVARELRSTLDLIADNNHEIYHSIEKQAAKDSFNKQNFMTKCKMIVNISKEWKAFAFEKYKNKFESLTEDEESNIFIKRMIMQFQLWNDNADEIISKMIDERHQVIKELFGVIIKSQGLVVN